MDNGLTPYAHQVPGVRDPKLGVRRTRWGYMLHTTGSGVTARAKKNGTTPLEEALKIYIASQNGSNGYKWGGPSYVINYDGELYQLAPDYVMTAHAGSDNRPLYLGGTWTTLAKPEAVAQWRKQWPGRKSPYHLFPSTSPNVDYIGCEMVPCADGFGTPRPGTRFTQAQHDAAIKLGRELAMRIGWAKGWNRSSRLLGHEDVDPIERDDAGGGWDPGFLRALPYFDFAYVRTSLD